MTTPRPGWNAPGGPLLAVLILLVAALAGGIGGVAADRLLLLPGMHRGPWHGPGGPHGGPPRDHDFRNRFAREVGLTPEQQIRVDSIMDRQGRELRAVRRQVQPQVDSIISRTRRALDSLLTPEQRKRAEAMRRRHPPPPGPPDGPPPR